MRDMNKDSRRDVLLKSVSAASGIAGAFAATVIPASALGRDGHVAPSERINMGLIGAGHHALTWNIPRMLANHDQLIRAVCDVDAERLQEGASLVDSLYSKKLNRDYRCKRFADFRDLINVAELDAVAIATPDHWHVIPALMALKSVKNVIC